MPPLLDDETDKSWQINVEQKIQTKFTLFLFTPDFIMNITIFGPR